MLDTVLDSRNPKNYP